MPGGARTSSSAAKKQKRERRLQQRQHEKLQRRREKGGGKGREGGSAAPPRATRSQMPTARQKRREAPPPLVETTRSGALFVRAQSCSETMLCVLRELQRLKAGHGQEVKLLTRKARKGAAGQGGNQVRPFDDTASIEFLLDKNHCSLFAVASHTKKRPNNLVLGRTFDGHILDMFELGITLVSVPDAQAEVAEVAVQDPVQGQEQEQGDEDDDEPRAKEARDEKEEEEEEGEEEGQEGAGNARRIRKSQAGESASGVGSIRVGSSPLLLFQGDDWEHDPEMKQLQSLLLDFFKGRLLSGLALTGVDHVLVISLHDGVLRFRPNAIVLKKSGSRVPRVQLLPVPAVPRFDARVRRTHMPSEALWRAALRQPQQIQPKKVKNISKSALGDKLGRIHMARQDLDSMQVRRSKALRNSAKREREGGDGADGEQGTASDTATAAQAAKRARTRA